MMAGLILLLAFFAGPGAAAADAGGETGWDELLNAAATDMAGNDYESAAKKYKDVIEADPGNVRALIGLAELYATAENPDFYNGQLAVEFALRALDKAPEDVRVIEVLAESFFAQAQYERAVTELVKCIRAMPANSRYHNRLRRYALTWKGRLDINYPGRTVPEKGKAFFYLGMADFHLGEFEKALESLQNAYDANAGVPDGGYYLASAMIATGDAGLAIDVLKGTGEGLKSDPRIMHLMGRALAEVEDLDAAVPYLRQARELQPGLEGLRLDLGKAYLRMGDNVKALMVFREALRVPAAPTAGDRAGRAELALLAGRTLARLQEFDKALGMYYQAAAALVGESAAERELAALYTDQVDPNGEMRAYFAGRGSGEDGGGESGAWEAPVLFEDVSREAGVSGDGGVSWGDFDQDGDPDLLVGGTTLFRNEGRGSFRDVSSDLGLTAVRDSRGGLFADTDNDGDLDLLVFCGTMGLRDRLFRNDGKAGFRDISEEPGSPTDAMPTAGGSFGDLNGDGAVDLYLVSAGQKEPAGAEGGADSLFLNSGKGVFSEAADAAGVVLERPLSGNGAIITDYDNDGDMDIYVTNGALEPNVLWRNDSGAIGDKPGSVRFSSAGGDAFARGVDVHGRFGSTQCALTGDLDGDSDIDFFLCNTAPFLDRPFADRSQVLLSSGRPQFAFRDAFAGSGLCDDEAHAGAVLGDVDNDGDLDLFITERGAGRFARLYVNDGGGRFQDVTWLAGLRVEDAGECALADYDGDGDLDVYVSGRGGRLLANSGNDNHWIGFRLKGKECGATGISARVTIASAGRSMVREVMGGRGNCQDDMAVHFGLGTFKDRVNVSVQWPNGKSAYLQGFKVDRYHTLKE